MLTYYAALMCHFSVKFIILVNAPIRSVSNIIVSVLKMQSKFPGISIIYIKHDILGY